MAEFKRARSAEQKCQRMGEIKGAARRQFDARPYHQITLTTIAGELGWSRANLYKYVSTIFLLVMADLRDAYTADLVDALSTPCALDASTAARAWAQVAGRHRTYFRYGDLLYTVIETNVTVDKLEQFKRGYYAQLPEVRERLSRGPCRVMPEQPARGTGRSKAGHRARARGLRGADRGVRPHVPHVVPGKIATGDESLAKTCGRAGTRQPERNTHGKL